MIDYNAQRLANFNPRSHEGSDSGYYHQGDRSCISIHAPTRGATRRRLRLLLHPVEFQSTLPRGERRCTSNKRSMHRAYFNPRSHEGSDGIPDAHDPEHVNFNPRSHEGSDEKKDSQARRSGISIHAPTRGATSLFRQLTQNDCNFNPRSHEGSDINRAMHIVHATVFQSTLPRGERHLQNMQQKKILIFQSTLPRGERRYYDLVTQHRVNNFNPRSHEGSDMIWTL